MLPASATTNTEQWTTWDFERALVPLQISDAEEEDSPTMDELLLRLHNLLRQSPVRQENLVDDGEWILPSTQSNGGNNPDSEDAESNQFAAEPSMESEVETDSTNNFSRGHSTPGRDSLDSFDREEVGLRSGDEGFRSNSTTPEHRVRTTTYGLSYFGFRWQYDPDLDPTRAL